MTTASPPKNLPYNQVLARRFVELVEIHREDINAMATKPDEDVETLFHVVRAAGLNPKKLVRGQIVNDQASEQMKLANNGKPCYLNDKCPCIVIGQDDKQDTFATKWLNDAVKYVLYSSRDIAFTVEILRTEIELSVPFEPIKVIQVFHPAALLGESVEYPHRLEFGEAKGRLRRTDRLRNIRLFHVGCSAAPMELIDNSVTKETVLVCKRCFLRILVPHKSETLEEVDEHFNPKNE